MPVYQLLCNGRLPAVLLHTSQIVIASVSLRSVLAPLTSRCSSGAICLKFAGVQQPQKIDSQGTHRIVPLPPPPVMLVAAFVALLRTDTSPKSAKRALCSWSTRTLI
jgi:hypothetical protein